MAHMLSPSGRCNTFDASADGFARGEGCGGFLVQASQQDDNNGPLFAGSAVNQDGRSASLTAPNGPSQQDVLRSAFRSAGFHPHLLQCSECHGTGTALGDPIEVGALMAVLTSYQREMPLELGSVKSNNGHLEPAAGAVGFIKCLLLVVYACAPANLHLRRLNPHIEVSGFPCKYASECVPI